MRSILIFGLILLLTAPCLAQEVGFQKPAKGGGHLLLNPVSDTREGGEDASTAIVVDVLPFADTGATCDNTDEYDLDCPYPGPGSPDVVYSLTPAADSFFDIDLCGSGYDTRLIVLDENLEAVACNDDTYNDVVCGQYTSLIRGVNLLGGAVYYIVVDGYGGDCGGYELAIRETDEPTPCVVRCAGSQENEPALGDGYVDVFNGGCNSIAQPTPFQELEASTDGELAFGGVSGWFDESSRDTDWFLAFIGPEGVVEWTLDAEQPVQGMVLNSVDCENPSPILSFQAGPCLPATVTISGNPGSVLILWVGPKEFIPPADFTGHEFDYMMVLYGMQPGTIATDALSWDAVKSLYR